MRKFKKVSLVLASLTLVLTTTQVSAGARKSRKAPKPINKGISYDAYKGTDIAQIKYKNYRREFRVGHSPYFINRFHVAEYILLTEYVDKYTKPDYTAEIKMAPDRTKPKLMANKTFQARWKELIKSHKSLISFVTKIKIPKECKMAKKQFLQALKDELFFAEKIAERMFVAQDTHSRERLKEDLTARFRSRNPKEFDKILSEFEDNADLSSFYAKFFDLLIKPGLDKAAEFSKRAMDKTGLEYATAVEEEGDITSP